MQILALVLYKDDAQRILRFKPGAMNVLPGLSLTGKSSILEIVEFCLGRTEPTFAKGALDVVTWFGLLVEHEGTRVFLGRPAPRLDAASASSAMLLLGVEDVPSPTDLRINTDAGSIREELTRLVGIDDNEALVPAGTRDPLRASISQALLLCFQGQGEIANPARLFHRSDEDYVSQALKDTLPFFLGAVGPDHVAAIHRLQEMRRELRQVQRDIAQIQQTTVDSDINTAALIADAASVGLLALDETGTAESGRELLRRAAEAADPGAADEDRSLRVRETLRQEQRELNDALRRIQERRISLQEFRQAGVDFRTEVQEQRSRLRSLNLLPHAHSESATSCPICHSELPTSDTTANSLRQAVVDLDGKLATADALEPQRKRLVFELRREALDLRVQLRRVQTALAGLARNEQMAARYAEQSERRAFVRGRIAQFLEGLVAAEPNRVAYLQLRESELSREVGRLDEALDPDAVASEVATRLSFVNETLTDLARELQLEHSEHQVRIDLPNLTLVADTRERGAIPLRRIGSASNQVGYHVTAHLALHKWFVEERRPVPGFLILDQPEQAYYPDDIPESVRDPSILLKESDEARVRGLYGLINRIVTDLGGRFQVIVVGHANLTDLEWFEDARVEDWKTDGAGLVPMDWLRPQPASAREHD